MKALTTRLDWVRLYLQNPGEFEAHREDIVRELDEAIAIAEALPEIELRRPSELREPIVAAKSLADEWPGFEIVCYQVVIGDEPARKPPERIIELPEA